MGLKDLITPTVRQVLTASSIGMAFAGAITTWGYPAVALPQMEHSKSTIQFTPEQASWFATLPLFMMIPISMGGATISEWIGPRRTFLALTPLLCVSFMSMAAASWEDVQEAGMAEVLLLTSRAIQGIFAAVLHTTAPVYTFEISDRHNRKILTSLRGVWHSVGFLLCYITGCFLSWYTIAWLLPLLTLVPGYLGILLSPESPLWLARKGREEEAREVLNRYRSSSQEVIEDLKVVRSSQKVDVKFSDSLRLLGKKPNALAITASAVVLLMKEFIGFPIVLIYMVHIFEAAGIGLDPRYSAVIIGSVRLLCTGFASYLLHNFRRKTLLITGNSLTAIGTGVLGLFFYLQTLDYDMSGLGWLPITCLAIYMFASASTIGPSTWMAAVEILPGPVRTIGFGIAVTCFSTNTFLVTKTFVGLSSLVGMHGAFWCFTGGSLSFILIVIFFIPETYGLSLQDIEDYWYKSPKEKKIENDV